jgi:hypothetical protein
MIAGLERLSEPADSAALRNLAEYGNHSERAQNPTVTA